MYMYMKTQTKFTNNQRNHPPETHCYIFRKKNQEDKYERVRLKDRPESNSRNFWNRNEQSNPHSPPLRDSYVSEQSNFFNSTNPYRSSISSDDYTSTSPDLSPPFSRYSSSSEERSPVLFDASRPPPRVFCDYSNLFSLSGQVLEMCRGPRGSTFLVERIRQSTPEERRFLMAELRLPMSLALCLQNSYSREVVKALMMKDGVIRNELIQRGKILKIDVYQAL